MDHLVTTVGQHFAISWWWAIPALVGTIGGPVVAKVGNSVRGSVGLLVFFASIFALAMVVSTQIGSSHDEYEERHPSVTTIAHGFGLRDLPGQDDTIDDSTKTFLDKDGSRYSQCYSETTKIDTRHVSSRLLCASSGKNVTVRRQS